MTTASSDFTRLRQAESQAGWIGVWSFTVSISFARFPAISARMAASALRRLSIAAPLPFIASISVARSVVMAASEEPATSRSASSSRNG
jgi:hypothetical protein